ADGYAPLVRLVQQMQPLTDLQERIIATVVEDAPAQTAKGGIICEGVSTELDDLRKISRSGKSYLLEIQQKESARTGIPSVKISFNNVYGYYLEVTNTHKDKVPPEWVRNQTLANAERYITQELKEYEEMILGAEEKILAIELALYQDVLAEIEPY